MRPPPVPNAAAPAPRHGEIPRVVRALEFALLSTQKVLRMSELHVTARDLYQAPTRLPAPFVTARAE